MDRARAVSHDRGEGAFRPRDASWGWLGNTDGFFIDETRMARLRAAPRRRERVLVVNALCGVIVSTASAPWVSSRYTGEEFFVEGLVQPLPQRILLPELVANIARV
jgi:hypothetical protein